MICKKRRRSRLEVCAYVYVHIYTHIHISEVFKVFFTLLNLEKYTELILMKFKTDLFESIPFQYKISYEEVA